MFMKIKINIFFFLLFFIKFKKIISSTSKTPAKRQSGICTLTRKPSQDPFPSLSKCYKYNNEACCLSVHDDYISSHVDSILSPSCVRKYPEFENLMCFGCHPLESNYIVNDTIRICKSFAENLWNSTEVEDGLNQPTTVFDNCGFKVDLEDLSNLANGSSYIIPSEVFPSIYAFFDYIKIPFYEDYKIEIVDSNDETCYNYSLYIKICLFYFILFLIFFI